jgi:hypothetical protein
VALDFGPDPTTTSSPKPTVGIVTYPTMAKGPGSGISFFTHPYPEGFPVGVEARLTYSVYFEPYFIWAATANNKSVNMAGLLPGLFGGRTGGNASAEACIPGSPDATPRGCFAVRPVWGSGGQSGVHLSAPSSQACSVSSNPTTLWDLKQEVGGFVVGMGTWAFDSDLWYSVEIYVKLNSFTKAGAAKENGQLSVRINGIERISLGNLVWRSNGKVSIQSVHMGSYFLESADFPANQHVLFRDFQLDTRPRGADELAVANPAQPTPAPVPESEVQVAEEEVEEVATTVVAAIAPVGATASKDDGGSNVGLIVGVAVGVGAAVVVAAITVAVVVLRRRAQHRQQAAEGKGAMVDSL